MLNANFIVIASFRDLEEAEDQFQMALRTHLQNIDVLIQLHDSRLYSLERNFQQELKTMQHDFHSEKERMQLKFKQEKKELVAVIETIEHDENAREAEVIRLLVMRRSIPTTFVLVSGQTVL